MVIFKSKSSNVNTATANGSGLEEHIVTLSKNHGYTIISDDVYAQATS
jgi:hypothetical protein